MKKIIWSVDPFIENQEIQKHASTFLKVLSNKTGAMIEPTYVLSDGLMGLSAPKPILTRHFVPLTKAALAKVVSKLNIKRIRKPHIIVSVPSSRSVAAKALDRYANKMKADYIFISSHGRKGLKRIFLGSFAETVLLNSKTPVIISGPKNKSATNLNTILFPTDFSKSSENAFAKVLEISKSLKANLTLLHAVPSNIDAVIQPTASLLGGGWVSIQNYVNLTEDNSSSRAKEWIKKASKKGVKATYVIDYDTSGIADSVVRMAKKKNISMIVMASQSGAFASAVIGSVGRQVARNSPCAVCFIHS